MLYHLICEHIAHCLLFILFALQRSVCIHCTCMVYTLVLYICTFWFLDKVLSFVVVSVQCTLFWSCTYIVTPKMSSVSKSCQNILGRKHSLFHKKSVNWSIEQDTLYIWWGNVCHVHQVQYAITTIWLVHFYAVLFIQLIQYIHNIYIYMCKNIYKLILRFEIYSGPKVI